MKTIKMSLTVDVEKLLPLLQNDKQHTAFLKAIGRQVMYAMSYGGVNSDVEMLGGVYHTPVFTEQIEICFTYKIENNEHGFTMAAVSRNNGEEYSYHS